MSTDARYSALPSVDQLLKDTRSQTLLSQFGRNTVVSETQNQLAILRGKLRNYKDDVSRESLTTALLSAIQASLSELFSLSLRPVHNLTGVILHTNLGRAPYPQTAIDAMVAVSQGACNLEFNLHNGKRGRRDDHVENWICRLTGAEAATTVNNNAAAVLLVLNTLAEKKQVIVSRGELIEIGGSFRIPAIMKKAGCKLREVGTTNRTHLSDYEEAIGKKTSALMKVHTSNYEINGFNHSVSAAELASLARSNDLPLIDDLGSGSLIDLTGFGLPAERTAAEALAEGVDVITFSGDKLLGGPQCGIIAGRRDLIKQIDKNPMKRAMRLDKVTLAALEAVLKLYAKPESIGDELPALKLLSRTAKSIQQTAQELLAALQKQMPDSVQLSIESCESQIGSGALPTKTLASYAVVLRPVNEAEISTDSLATAFRQLPTPVIGRTHDHALWLDCRALTDCSPLTQSIAALPAISRSAKVTDARPA